MAIRAGLAPWSDGYKRTTQKAAAKQGIDWSLSSGYRQKPTSYLQQPGEWSDLPRKAKTKRIKLYNGRHVEVYDGDYEDFISHHRSETADPDSEIGNYIYNAFDSGTHSYEECDGVGHIKYIEYSPTFQLLRVEFGEGAYGTGGATVVYFRVPTAAYSELLHLAQGGKTFIDDKGVERHLLGKRFWDIIRIRGQRTGGRYRYEYANENRSAAQVKDKADISTANMEAEEKEDLNLYNHYAKNFLTGSMLNHYNALRTVKAREQFLQRMGII